MTNITITVPADYFLGSVVDGKPYPVRVDKMSNEALLHVFEYGLKRIINDRTGGKDKTPEDKAEIARDMVERLEAATYERRASGEASDPVLNWVRNIIREQLMANKASERHAEYKAADADGRRAILDDIYDRQPDDVKEKVYALASAAREKHLAEKAAAAKATAGIGLTI